jgi:hypothetical protein
MAQSSALRRDADSPSPSNITIDSNNTPHPKNDEIASDGSIQFNAAQACWLYFSPTGVFGDASGLLELQQGSANGPYYPQQQNVTVSYCVTNPNTTCNPAPAARNVASITDAKTPLTGGNTIKVG